ncbi:MAG: acyl-CoA dehydrogenase [Deltaproteobacteria bacterium]|nr:acyl-CoA dehydrogenase [Deltaproteobacteria bacterium]
MDELTEGVRRFARERLDALAIDAAEQIDPSVLTELAELGLFGLSIPEAHGGLGLRTLEICDVIAAMAEEDRSVATTVGLHAGLGTHGLLLFGNDEQKARFLPELASGERIASFAATEPTAGSDLNGVRTIARLEGDELVIDGEKSYVTNGGFAGLFTVLVKTPGLGGRRAHGLVMIPRETPGVVIGAEEHKLGIRGSSTITLHLEGVRIPRGYLLGEEGQGMHHAHAVLALGRTVMAAGCLGTAVKALALAYAHGQTRVQFRKPIGDMEASRAHLAHMASLVHAMRASVADVAARREAGESIETASTVAKVFCSEGAFDVTDRNIQLHGALGFIEETGVPLLARDCRVTRIFEGANDVLLVRLGAALLASKALHDERLPRDADSTPAGRAALEVDARLRHETAALGKRLGVRAIERQRLLLALARAHMNLAVVGALLSQEANEPTDLGRHARAELLTEARSQLDNLPRLEEVAGLERRITDSLGSAAPA